MEADGGGAGAPSSGPPAPMATVLVPTLQQQPTSSKRKAAHAADEDTGLVSLVKLAHAGDNPDATLPPHAAVIYSSPAAQLAAAGLSSDLQYHNVALRALREVYADQALAEKTAANMQVIGNQYPELVLEAVPPDSIDHYMQDCIRQVASERRTMSAMTSGLNMWRVWLNQHAADVPGLSKPVTPGTVFTRTHGLMDLFATLPYLMSTAVDREASTLRTSLAMIYEMMRFLRNLLANAGLSSDCKRAIHSVLPVAEVAAQRARLTSALRKVSDHQEAVPGMKYWRIAQVNEAHLWLEEAPADVGAVTATRAGPIAITPVIHKLVLGPWLLYAKVHNIDGVWRLESTGHAINPTDTRLDWTPEAAPRPKRVASSARSKLPKPRQLSPDALRQLRDHASAKSLENILVSLRKGSTTAESETPAGHPKPHDGTEASPSSTSRAAVLGARFMDPVGEHFHPDPNSIDGMLLCFFEDNYRKRAARFQAQPAQTLDQLLQCLHANAATYVLGEDADDYSKKIFAQTHGADGLLQYLSFFIDVDVLKCSGPRGSMLNVVSKLISWLMDTGRSTRDDLAHDLLRELSTAAQ